jgi:hypothetical protein
LAWAVVLVLAWAWAWAWALLLALALVEARGWAEKKGWKWLENVAKACLLFSFTPLGIPFFFAIRDMNDESFGEQKIFQITMGTIVSGLIVGGGLGLLVRLGR